MPAATYTLGRAHGIQMSQWAAGWGDFEQGANVDAKQQDFDKHDFFRSDRFINDPYTYFDYLREQSPLVREPHQCIIMVTGYDEALEIYNDSDRFSSCMSTTGPFAGCPIPLQGRENEDISELIEEYREKTPFYDQLPTMDPPVHSDHRALLMRLLDTLARRTKAP